jgi:hypothetical protein
MKSLHERAGIPKTPCANIEISFKTTNMGFAAMLANE